MNETCLLGAQERREERYTIGKKAHRVRVRSGVCVWGGGMCLRSVEGVGHAVEIGVGILDEDLLDNPPDGRTVGNMVVQASRHSRVQHGERVAVSRED